MSTRSAFTRRVLLLAASLTLLTSCESDKSPTGLTLTGIIGTLSFSYSGAISGTYSATGELSAELETSPWAAAVLLTSDGFIVVESAAPRSASTHDFITLVAERTTAGASTIAPNCTANSCAVANFSFGVANVSGATVQQNCELLLGTMTITEITATRVRGTFSGTGECLAQGSSTAQAFTVTNGSFDAALLSDLP